MDLARHVEFHFDCCGTGGRRLTLAATLRQAPYRVSETSLSSASSAPAGPRSDSAYRDTSTGCARPPGPGQACPAGVERRRQRFDGRNRRVRERGQAERVGGAVGGIRTGCRESSPHSPRPPAAPGPNAPRPGKLPGVRRLPLRGRFPGRRGAQAGDVEVIVRSNDPEFWLLEHSRHELHSPSGRALRTRRSASTVGLTLRPSAACDPLAGRRRPRRT